VLRRAAEPADGQRCRWDEALARPGRYGDAPSAPALWAAERFAEAGVHDVLELGAGQGRDSVHFARLAFDVHALDFACPGVRMLRKQAAEHALPGSIQALRHDCRGSLPFADSSFDACFSHMLYCMDLSTGQLERLSAEVRRVLRPGGLQVYTARSTADPDFGCGAAHGDDRSESNGFVVHFFSGELVERLSRGFALSDVEESEEGDLPRRLYRVTQRRSPD
jgi:SAM-dependent methyltransferase